MGMTSWRPAPNPGRTSAPSVTIRQPTGGPRIGGGWGRTSPTDSATTWLTYMDLWNNEKVDYDYGTNSCASGKVCGHYTQARLLKNSAG